MDAFSQGNVSSDSVAQKMGHKKKIKTDQNVGDLQAKLDALKNVRDFLKITIQKKEQMILSHEKDVEIL